MSYPPVNETINRHDLVLTWKRFAAIDSVPPCVRDMELDLARDFFVERMVVRATGYVLGETLPSHTETSTGFAHFEAPASWWQHLKHQHGHRWWLRPLVRRRPARMDAQVRRVTLTATWENMAAYPWADIATIAPNVNLGNPVRLTWMTSSMKWDGSDTP